MRTFSIYVLLVLAASCSGASFDGGAGQGTTKDANNKQKSGGAGGNTGSGDGGSTGGSTSGSTEGGGAGSTTSSSANNGKTTGAKTGIATNTSVSSDSGALKPTGSATDTSGDISTDGGMTIQTPVVTVPTIGDGGSDYVTYFSPDGLNFLDINSSPQASPAAAKAAIAASKNFVSSGDGAAGVYRYWLFHAKQTTPRITTDNVATRTQMCAADEVVVGHPPYADPAQSAQDEGTVLCAALVAGLKTANQTEMPYVWDFNHLAECPGSSVQVGHKCASTCDIGDQITLVCAEVVKK